MKKTAANNPYSIPSKAKPAPKLKGEAHSYDSNRPKKQVVSRYK